MSGRNDLQKLLVLGLYGAIEASAGNIAMKAILQKQESDIKGLRAHFDTGEITKQECIRRMNELNEEFLVNLRRFPKVRAFEQGFEEVVHAYVRRMMLEETIKTVGGAIGLQAEIGEVTMFSVREGGDTLSEEPDPI